MLHFGTFIVIFAHVYNLFTDRGRVKSNPSQKNSETVQLPPWPKTWYVTVIDNQKYFVIKSTGCGAQQNFAHVVRNIPPRL